MRWSEVCVARVAVTSAWVSPLVKRAEPWALGRTPTSQEMGLIWSSFLPSMRTRSFSTLLRT